MALPMPAVGSGDQCYRTLDLHALPPVVWLCRSGDIAHHPHRGCQVIIHVMGHSRDDKARSHERIVEIAAARLRESGTAGPGVAELMKAAGLTHGGFYKHFDSRDDLVAEAVERALRDNEGFMTTLTAGAADAHAALRAFVDWYTSAEHRDAPGAGCAVVAFGADAPRADQRVRTAYTGQVRAVPGAPGSAARRPQAGRRGAQHPRRRRPGRPRHRPRRAVGRDPGGGAGVRARHGAASRSRRFRASEFGEMPARVSSRATRVVRQAGPPRPGGTGRVRRRRPGRRSERCR